ncbi:flagellar hook-length control protein FliK [Scandinavium sp.]|uniref:flagellar hook-length control protein FliK n=1 Tax=Scandinavium sp. TaxID=2830653 RepID=UPI00289B10BB|nr:flagellar hook-length control protein FliK [Scandinavium sp.]
MIAKILPVVNAASASPSSKPAAQTSDEPDFLATLEEKTQPKGKDTSNMAATENPEQSLPLANGGKLPGKKEESADAEADVAVLPLLDITLAELVAPPVDVETGVSPEPVDGEIKQHQLQQLVTNIQALPAATEPVQAQPLTVATPGLADVAQKGLQAAESQAALPDVDVHVASEAPMRSLMAQVSVEDRMVPKRFAEVVHEAQENGDDATSTLQNSKEPLGKEILPAVLKTQEQGGTQPLQNTDNRFGVMANGALHSLTSANTQAAARAPELSQTPGTMINQTVGTPAWQQALSHQLSYFTRNGVHNAELRLHPEELGSLQINLRLNSDKAQLHFVTENHQVRAALEAAMPHLRTSLAESGIELGQSSVGSESPAWQEAFESEHSSGQQHSEEGNGNGNGRIADEESEPLVVMQRTYSNGINTFI